MVPLRAGEPNHETRFIFEKFEMELPELIDNVEIKPDDKIILVDHNEESQRSNKFNSDQVIEILDHHKINVSFTSPIRIDVKPVGSSSTVVYEHFKTSDLNPTVGTLGLMLSAILDDTQGLKSSTTTGMDSDFAHEIAITLGADLDKQIFELFKAKSDITGLSVMDIVRKDFKIFDFGIKVFIGVIETVEPEKVLTQKDEVIKALGQIKLSENVPQAYFFVVDILKVNTLAIYSTDDERKIVETAFSTTGNGGIADIGPKTSRKKDIAPALEKAIKG